MKYRIGLDIGISSVGWSVLEHDNLDNPRRIVDLGVRVFDAAENPKDGTSLAVDRREARGLRRRLRRRADRIAQTRHFLSELLAVKPEKISINKDIVELRNKALDARISDEDLYSVVLYLVKHRGFKSNRKSETAGGEGGKMLKSIKSNLDAMQEKGYRTIGEYIYNDERYFVINDKGVKEYQIRNHPIGAKGSYDKCFARKDLEYELKLILQTQQQLGNGKITNQAIDTILNLFNKQRSFDEGPNEPSKYKANFAVGKDIIFEKDEYRAPKGSFTFEYFNALQKINNLTLLNNGTKIKLTEEQKLILRNAVLDSKELKYSKVRKLLGLSYDGVFAGLSYVQKKKKSKNTEDTTPQLSGKELIDKCEDVVLCKMAFSYDVCKKLDVKLGKDYALLIDAVGYVISMRKSDDARRLAFAGDDSIIENLDDKRRSALSSLSKDNVENLLFLETSQFGNLSFKAMTNIIPYLEQGMVYSDACKAAGYDFNKAYSNMERKKKIVWADLQEELQQITSNVVLRSLSQTIKVVNAIIDKYGSPSAIFVELAREMSKNRAERDQIKKSQEERQKDNERFKNHLLELGITPSGQDIVKYRLYEEQGGVCMYSGKSFDKELGGLAGVFSNNATQIDHIIPYSKCFDDSYNNKVLVMANENQLKGNRLPYEYMSAEQFAAFTERVQANNKYSYTKKNKLLKKSLSDEEVQELNNRALNDTKHVARFALNMFKTHLIFEDSAMSKLPVRAVNGAMTSYLRKIWGLNKVRFENDRHHALDATVVACCTNYMINKVSRYLQFKNYRERHKDLKVEYIDGVKYYIDDDGVLHTEKEYDMLFGPHIPQPYENFVNELEARLSKMPLNETAIKVYQSIGYSNEEIDAIHPIFVSRMPTRKVKGPIHEQTLRRLLITENGAKKVVTKTDLQNIHITDDHDIEGYSDECKKSDPLLYKALMDRLAQFDYDSKLAFKEPFYKPKANGEQGPLVKKIKIESNPTDYVMLKNKAIASKGKMVRIDIFTRNGKNYMVPVYVCDAYKGVLPNKAVVAHKPMSKWLEMTNEYKFKFSVYPNDLILVESKRGFSGSIALSKKSTTSMGKTFGYYVKADRSSGNVTFNSVDKDICYGGIGIQNLTTFEKYSVDVLGNVSKINKEKRMNINIKQK